MFKIFEASRSSSLTLDLVRFKQCRNNLLLGTSARSHHNVIPSDSVHRRRENTESDGLQWL